MADGTGPDAGVQRGPLMYCDMAGGGWTLVLKIDGTNPSSRFFYPDPLWTNDQTLNGSQVDLSQNEAKYETFMATPFSQVRLQATLGGTQRTMTFAVPPSAGMLRNFLDAPIGTAAGRAAWTNTFAAGATLQANCGAEGFNQNPAPGRSRVRLGILGNEQNDCGSPDSFAGIGGELVPSGDCREPDAGVDFRGYSAGAFGGGTCTGGTANGGAFTLVWVQ
jgi:hypothetical protein